MTFEDEMVTILVKKLEGKEQPFLDAYEMERDCGIIKTREIYPHLILKRLNISLYNDLKIPSDLLEPIVIAARKKILDKQPKVDNSDKLHYTCKYYFITDDKEPCKTCMKDRTKPYYEPKGSVAEVCL